MYVKHHRLFETPAGILDVCLHPTRTVVAILDNTPTTDEDDNMPCRVRILNYNKQQVEQIVVLVQPDPRALHWTNTDMLLCLPKHSGKQVIEIFSILPAL